MNTATDLLRGLSGNFVLVCSRCDNEADTVPIETDMEPDLAVCRGCGVSVAYDEAVQLAVRYHGEQTVVSNFGRFKHVKAKSTMAKPDFILVKKV